MQKSGDSSTFHQQNNNQLQNVNETDGILIPLLRKYVLRYAQSRMTEKRAFEYIDDAIQTFKEKEGLHKGIKISKRPHSDWLVFSWRQLTWKENGFEHILEIVPEFDTKEHITGWTVYAAGYFDANRKRHYAKNVLVVNQPLEIVVRDFYELLKKGNIFLQSLKKEDIPATVDLK